MLARVMIMKGYHVNKNIQSRNTFQSQYNASYDEFIETSDNVLDEKVKLEDIAEPFRSMVDCDIILEVSEAMQDDLVQILKKEVSSNSMIAAEILSSNSLRDEEVAMFSASALKHIILKEGWNGNEDIGKTLIERLIKVPSIAQPEIYDIISVFGQKLDVNKA